MLRSHRNGSDNKLVGYEWVGDRNCELVAMAKNKTRAAFVEPMLLLRTETLPKGKAWMYELKFDGYRALAIKSGGRLHLRSRNDNDFNVRYPGIVSTRSTALTIHTRKRAKNVVI